MSCCCEVKKGEDWNVYIGFDNMNVVSLWQVLVESEVTLQQIEEGMGGEEVGTAGAASCVESFD